MGRIFGGFWEGFGGSWHLLGRFLASNFGACIQNTLQNGFRRLLASILASFSRVWERSGMVWGEFVGPKIVFLLGWLFGFRVLVAGAFRELWHKNKVP